MATIYEVSELAGVSLATVSRVMNQTGRVSEKTRDKVLAAMAQLNYRPNSVAQSLASNLSNCVGVLVSEVHGPIFGAMLSGIEQELREAGKFTIFATGHTDKDKEQEGIQFLLSRNCDALILHVEAMSDATLLALKDTSAPFVIINRIVPGLEEQCISLSNEHGGYAATKHLLELGHRRIAYISGPLGWGDAGDRLTGHKKALRDADIKFNEQLLVEGDYHESTGAEAMRQLLTSDESFTAVVCANDEMAAGAMDAIRGHGLSIPRDLSVVGFDNALFSRYLYPKLTTINYPVAEMGQTAARYVLQQVYEAPSKITQHRFEPELVVRASTSPHNQ